MLKQNHKASAIFRESETTINVIQVEFSLNISNSTFRTQTKWYARV